ncbi:hypothetical protein [Romboutsia ilealis]|uniref:hypothetical protein n=1 Tax=Romboutsia ilealis TaxID=1115758 RepID=UPI0024947D59|nr:hypothetical protein [Romboutsia ilealis]
MINFNKKTIDLEINKKKYIASLDVRTIIDYKNRTKKNFLMAIGELGENPDIVELIDLLGSIVKDSKGKCVGREFFMDFNPIDVMTELLPVLLEVVDSNLPQAKNEQEGK